MIPSFNTAGPCVPGEHYMLSPAPRLGEVMKLVDERKYFVLHAGHQTGKTTCARWLVDHYNPGERYLCTWVDIQTAREVPDPETAFRVVLENLNAAIHRDLPGLAWPESESEVLLRTPQTAVFHALRELSARAARPLVVLIDEADGLVGPAMVSFLTQIRQGYLDRSRMPFPHSVVLIGRRQVRDYIVAQEDRRVISWLGTSSPFNVTAEAPTLSLFSPKDVNDLIQQHTDKTGQVFLPEASERVFYLSQGQPWLVNALCDRVVNRDVEDRGVSITAAHVDDAKETIIQQRRTHIDALLARLREDRVRRIIEPMLVGDRAVDSDVLNDDIAYILDLGLAVRQGGQLQIANPIYREVIPRALSYGQQIQINQEPSGYIRADGSLDMPRLMTEWQIFWREDGHLAAAGFSYREAGPHLMFMAFLQRIINGGGRIEREYGLGKGALDLLILWRHERHAIELKLRRDTETEARALSQVARYLDTAGLDQGYLVMFDLRKKKSWKEKLYLRKKKVADKLVWMVGC